MTLLITSPVLLLIFHTYHQDVERKRDEAVSKVESLTRRMERSGRDWKLEKHNYEVQPAVHISLQLLCAFVVKVASIVVCHCSACCFSRCVPV